MSFAENYFFSLVMNSPGGPDMVNGYDPKMHCSMAIAALSIFGRETKNSANWCGQQS